MGANPSGGLRLRYFGRLFPEHKPAGCMLPAQARETLPIAVKSLLAGSCAKHGVRNRKGGVGESESERVGDSSAVDEIRTL